MRGINLAPLFILSYNSTASYCKNKIYCDFNKSYFLSFINIIPYLPIAILST